MELYTLVSLIIGVFGAGYASLNAIRTNFENDLKDAFKTADERLDAIIKVRGEGNTASKCRNHRATIRRWWKIWSCANVIPAIVFCLIIFGVVGWVLVDWDNVTTQHVSPDKLASVRALRPWCWFRGLVGVLAGVNIICLATALIAWRGCQDADSRLNEHAESAKDPIPGLQNPVP